MQHIVKNLKSYAAVLSVLVLGFVLVTPKTAHAVETGAMKTGTFAAFSDGRWGWFKLVLEKDNSNNKGRVKIAVWCEPNNVLGGSRVACDAIQFGLTSTLNGEYTVQYWYEPASSWFDTAISGTTDPDYDTYYDPPTDGVANWTSWGCANQGLDQYRAYVENFRAASSNQWSSWKSYITPTWNGTLC